ncbi:MAG TPA: PAS domain S-box protein [Pyrinomonadaceae bacterium]|nr:PAS domain S-box protein [Pyrinomonadaceae bacterium]
MRSSLKTYILGFLALGAAVLLRWVLDPVMGNALPLVTLFAAVAAAVWLGGYRVAIPVTLVGYVACLYLFISRGELDLSRRADIVGLVAYLFTCALIILIGESARRAQTQAQQRQEVFRVTLRSIGDAVITTDTQGCITYINGVGEALTGWSLQDALGQPLDRVFHIVNEVTRSPVENPATRALRQGVIVGLANHTILIKKDGSECPIDDSAAPIRNEEGHVSGCVLIFRDVTAQRLAEREKANQLLTARLLASIVESSNDAIIGKSLDGIIQSWNAAAEQLFGYTAEQTVGQHISLVIPPERLAEEDQIIDSLRVGKRIEHYETERVRSDGQRIMVSLTISPIKDESGNVVGASKIARDVTAQKRAESDRQMFVTLVENSTDFIGISDLEGVPFFINRAGLDMVGLKDIEEARQIRVQDFFFPEDQAKIVNEFFPGVLNDGHGEIEIRFRHFKTGEARWMAYKVLALTDTANQPIAFATVSQDVTERRRLTDDLRRLAADLSEADRRKNEFLATLAHELRNPLAPMSNMLEVVKRADGDSEVLKRAHETLERQLGQMIRLVDDLLDLNRVTHDRLELRRSEVELSEVVQQAVEVARPLVDLAGHHLTIDLPDEPIHLNADRARLAQVFGNLLNNSCKYTRAGGSVSLSAKHVGDEVVVRVKDNGAGIPQDKLDSIFDMFTQVDRTSEQSQGGLGIGLTLVKRLTEMHGGSIEARSDGEGQGSEFIVRLPILKQSAAAEQDGFEGRSESQAQRRVLIVDDNRDSADSLAMLMGITGNKTYMAHDGVEAVEAVEKYRPEVVLLDIGLPGLDGHEVCRRVREQPWGKDIIVIALTGWGQEDDRRKSEEAGFNGHLVKPVDYDKLLELLSTLTNGRVDQIAKEKRA